MSNMNNPAFKKLYNEILEKKLKDYAVTLEAELNNMPNIVKGLDIGNTVASAEASMIPSGGILESVHRGNNLLDRLSGLGTAVKKGVKGLGIAAALSGALSAGFLTGTAGIVAKHSIDLRNTNLQTISNLPLVSGADVSNMPSILRLGVNSDVKINTGEAAVLEISKSAASNKETQGMFRASNKTVNIKNAARIDVFAHEISHANETNWPIALNRPGYIGDYSKNTAEEQLRLEFERVGYTSLVRNSKAKPVEYWTNTREMHSRLVEAIAHYSDDSAIVVTKYTLHPSKAMVEELMPIYNQIAHDSNIVRLRKLQPENYNLLTRNYLQTFADNLKKRLTTGELEEPVRITENLVKKAEYSAFLTRSVYPRIDFNDPYKVISQKEIQEKYLNNREFINESVKFWNQNIPPNIVAMSNDIRSKKARDIFINNYRKLKAYDTGDAQVGSVTNYYGAGRIASNFNTPLKGWNKVATHSSPTNVFKGALRSEIQSGITTDSNPGNLVHYRTLISDIKNSPNYNPNFPIFIQGCNFARSKDIQSIADDLGVPVAGLDGYGIFSLASGRTNENLDGIFAVTRQGVGAKDHFESPGSIKVFYPKGTTAKDFNIPIDNLTKIEEEEINNFSTKFLSSLKNE